MDKEEIIDMLEDTNIDKVVSINIGLKIKGKDIIRIDYIDKNCNFKYMRKEIE